VMQIDSQHSARISFTPPRSTLPSMTRDMQIAGSGVRHRLDKRASRFRIAWCRLIKLLPMNVQKAGYMTNCATQSVANYGVFLLTPVTSQFV
jgi:hypothetical protein